MRNVLPSLQQHILHRRYHRFNVHVTLASINAQHVLVEMRVKSCRVNVEHLTLAGKNGEHGLNAVKLFTIAQLNFLDEMIQHLNKIRKKFDVYDVSEPVE